MMSWLQKLDAKLGGYIDMMDESLSEPINRTLTDPIIAAKAALNVEAKQSALTTRTSAAVAAPKEAVRDDCPPPARRPLRASGS
jgi:hypothetical protein